jgi:hypothetical protein
MASEVSSDSEGSTIPLLLTTYTLSHLRCLWPLAYIAPPLSLLGELRAGLGKGAKLNKTNLLRSALYAPARSYHFWYLLKFILRFLV